MKKWLDDLYAILLKRGFKTLDNSLKNYDSLEKQISKIIETGVINAGQTLTFDINEYNIGVKDLVVLKCFFSDGKLACYPVIRNSENWYIRLNTLAKSPGVDLGVTGNGVLSIVNDTESNLEYSLIINTL